MTETRPGYYEATWTVPDGYNGQGFLIFVSYTDSKGNSTFETAKGTINIVQELLVTYKMESSKETEEVKRGGNPANIPASDKEGYKVSWKMNGLTVDPKTVSVHEDITFVAEYEKDPSQWVTVKFALPSNVEFEDGAVTKYEILKTKSLADQNVVTPAHKENTLPIGKKLQWKIDFDSNLTEDKTYTAELVKDDDQFKTITVEVGENGSIVNSENNNFEVLKITKKADIIAQAKGLVQADDYYQIKDLIFDEANNKVSVSFEKDPSKWVTVKFVKDSNVLLEKEVHVGQTYNDAGISAPDVTPGPGQKLVWTPEFNSAAQIEKVENSDEIVFKASFEKDQSQYKTITVEVGENGKLVDTNKNTFEVLNTATEDQIKAQAKELVKANDYYQIGAITIADNTASVSFEKDPTKWVDVTLKAGENLKLILKGTSQNDPLIFNVPIGTKLSELLNEENIQTRPSIGYIFKAWDPAKDTIDASNKEFIARAEKDPTAWVTIKFVAGEHGSFEESEFEDQEVILRTLWTDIKKPNPKANEGYIFDRWDPELPKDTTDKGDGTSEATVVTQSATYTAKFRAVDNLKYEVKYLQVDENGGKILDPYDKAVEIMAPKVVENKTYKEVVSEDAPDLNNFELVGEKNKTITIGLDPSQNVIEFTYKAKDSAIIEANNQISNRAKEKIYQVKSKRKDIDFSFDENTRTVFLQLHNPEAVAVDALMEALLGSGVFTKITEVEDIKSVAFADDKIVLYNEDGSRKSASAVKDEIQSKAPSVFRAFGFEVEENMDLDQIFNILKEKLFCGQWHGIKADLATEGQTDLNGEKIWVNDEYHFEFKVDDREVTFDAKGMGTFDNESTKKITRPYHASLGENLPVFKAKDGYQVKKYLVTYTRFKTPKEAGVTEIDEDALSKLIVQESKEVSADDLKDLRVEHNMVIKPITTEDPSQWVNVKFVLPEGVELADGAQTEYRVLKTKTLEEQGVKIPDHKAKSVAEGQKVVWDLDLNKSISEDTTFTARLEKDPDQYRTITVVAGDHGKLKVEGNNTFEVLKSVNNESIKAQAKELAQANEGYMIDSVSLEGDTANVSFIVDKNQTLPYTVKYFLDGVEQSDWQINSTVFLANPIVESVADKKPEYYDLDSVNSTQLPFKVSETDNVIEIKYIRPKISISFKVEGENGSISSSNPISMLKGSKWSDIKSKMPTVEANNGYLVKYEPALPTDDNYVFAEDTVYKIRFVKEGYALGDEQIADKNIVNRVYNDNSKKIDTVGPVKILKDGEDISENFNNIKYYDKKGGSEITDFDLSKGGQTFKAYMVASGDGGLAVEGQVYFKYGSVTIGKDSQDFLTMEDALDKAKDGDQIVVKYNTSFAEKAIGQDLYGITDHTINKGVTVLLPFDGTYSDNIEDKSAPQNGDAIIRNKQFVTLTLPEGHNLDIAGTLTLNAKTAGNHEKGAGRVYKDFYSQLEMGANSRINVKAGGRLNSIGFVIGEGEVIMEKGSEVLDLLMLHDYRGGTETVNIFRNIFPTDQFSMNNIEVPITIRAGSKYMARTHMRGGKWFFAFNITPTVGIIGGEDSLLNLKSGHIKKTYNIDNGKMNFDVYGDLELKNLTMKLQKSYKASTAGKEIPFCGLYNINIKSGATLTTIANAKLLPDMKLTIDQGATMNISKGSHVFVYGQNMYTGATSGWGQYMRPNAPRQYRKAPTYVINRDNPGQMIINGILNVYGGLAGPVKKGTSGKINFHEGSVKNLTIKHLVMGGNGIQDITAEYEEIN